MQFDLAKKVVASTEIVTKLNEALELMLKENRKLQRQVEYLMNQKADPKLEKQLGTMRKRIKRTLDVMAGLPREKKERKKRAAKGS